MLLKASDIVVWSFICCWVVSSWLGTTGLLQQAHHQHPPPAAAAAAAAAATAVVMVMEALVIMVNHLQQYMVMEEVFNFLISPSLMSL
jgi:hypothetical protein